MALASHLPPGFLCAGLIGVVVNGHAEVGGGKVDGDGAADAA